MFEVKWDHPLMMGNPMMMMFSWQMAAMKLLMNPANYKGFGDGYSGLRQDGVEK
jgi:hypothetical protein